MRQAATRPSPPLAPRPAPKGWGSCANVPQGSIWAPRAPEPEVIVQYNAETGELRDAHGERLDPQLMRWLITAAVIRPLETSSNGDALRMGRTIRYANRHMRRALTIATEAASSPAATGQRPGAPPTMSTCGSTAAQPTSRTLP